MKVLYADSSCYLSDLLRLISCKNDRLFIRNRILTFKRLYLYNISDNLLAFSETIIKIVTIE